MAPNINPPDDKASVEKNGSNLLKDYQILSREYDKILAISQEILRELKEKKDETKLSELLDQKLEVARNIKFLSQKIGSQDINLSSSKKLLLNEVKRELERIRLKADELWNLEREIKRLTENS